MSGMSVEKNWGGVAWTGSSHIHRSYATGFTMDATTEEFLLKAKPVTVMRVLARAGYHKMVNRQIGLSKVDFEWFMDDDEFAKLIYFLSYSSLMGKKPTLKGKRIINPHTQNVFIPIGVKGKCVVAIRFWCGDDEMPGNFNLGFRMRCEVLPEDGERDRARKAVEEMQRVTESIAELSEITNYTEVAEPVTEEEAGLRVRISSND